MSAKSNSIFSRHPLALTFIFAAICLAPVLFMRDFSPSNELRYLNISQEMIDSGNIFELTNQGEPYADKPPLYFWLMSLGKLIFGSYSMGWLALLSFIPALIIVWNMDRWVFGTKPDPSMAGARAAMSLLLLTCGLFTGIEVFMRMDMLMVMFIVLALRSFWKLYKGEGNRRTQELLLPIWIFLALFTKGPVGLLVPPLTIICFLLLRRQGRQIGKYLGFKTLGIVALLFGLWILGAWLDGGKEYINNLLFHQTVGRAVNAFHHKAPVWYYVPALLYCLVPWFIMLVGGLVASFGARRKAASFGADSGSSAAGGAAVSGGSATHVSATGSAAVSGGSSAPDGFDLAGRSDLEILFLTEIAVTFIMLSSFSSKLAVYLLPIIPFTVYLLPLVFMRTGYRKWMKVTMSITAWIVVAIVLAAFVAKFFLMSWEPVKQAFATVGFLSDHVIWSGLALMGIGALIAGIWSIMGKRLSLCIFMLSSSMLIGVYVAAMDMPRINTWIGYGNLCKEVPEGSEVATVRVSRPENMDFYLGRDVKNYGKDFDAFYKAEVEGKTAADGPLTLICGNDPDKIPGLFDFAGQYNYMVLGDYIIVYVRE